MDDLRQKEAARRKELSSASFLDRNAWLDSLGRKRSEADRGPPAERLERKMNGVADDVDENLALQSSMSSSCPRPTPFSESCARRG